MADAIDRLLRSLEDRFETDLGTTERVAASDLALSLLQDQSLRELAPRGSGLAADGRHGRIEVGTIGADFVADVSCSTYLRLSDVVLGEVRGIDAPLAYEGSLLDALRGLSRKRPELTVELADRSLTGILERVGRDHLVLITQGARVLVPGSAVASVSCVRGG